MPQESITNLLPKDLVTYNPELPEETKEALQLMGYQLKKSNYMGDVQLIVQKNRQISAAADVCGRAEMFLLEN